MGDRSIIVLGIVAGFFVVSFAAGFSPELVNGVLLLILVGTILGNADRWLPVFAQFSRAGSSSIKSTSPGASPGGRQVPQAL